MLKTGDIEFFDNSMNMVLENGLRMEAWKTSGEHGTSDLNFQFFKGEDENVTDAVDQELQKQAAGEPEEHDELVETITTSNVSTFLDYIVIASSLSI